MKCQLLQVLEKYYNKIMKKGISILEILIVILILSFLFSPTIFIILKYHQSSILKSTVEEITSTLGLARSLAINERKVVKVIFKGNKFFIEKDGKVYQKVYKFPENIKIKEMTDGFKPVVFLPDGRAKQAGYIVIFEENSKKEMKIVLYNLTGRCIAE